MEAILEPIVEKIRSGDLDGARQALSVAPKSEVSKQDLDFIDGYIAEREYDRERALEIYDRILEENPDHADATFRAALLLDQYGDDEAAIELYKKCIEVTPTPVSAMLNLAILLEESKRYAEAEALATAVLNEHPNHVRAKQILKSTKSSASMVFDDHSSRNREGHHAILDQPISDFELSVRSRNCLRQMNIRTLHDLLRTTEAELMSYRNFGETSLSEIKAMLKNRGLELGQAALPMPPSIVRKMTTPMIEVPVAAQRSIAELELSVRSRKALQRLGITTIGELTSHSEAELMTIKNFGLTSLEEIRQQLTKFGISLKGSP